LARSREHAVTLVSGGHVQVAGRPASKPATAVEPSVAIVVDESDGDRYVSRGAHKLVGALDVLDVPVAGRCCLDAGASTGGFTQVLLLRGARRVTAVDVGYGQLDWSLRADDRVQVLDRTNVRHLTPDALGGPVELTVADLSFISLRVVLPALLACTQPGGDLLLMVKPQFEVGRSLVGAGGVVRDPHVRQSAVHAVADAAWHQGWGTRGVTASPLPGPAGNVEYFLWLAGDAPPLDAATLTAAVAAGPA
jgi:23S rRNA (cytidine1920-2'-O)/16S rRNA (cytidine1409-2'-O)-methyltransferase